MLPRLLPQLTIAACAAACTAALLPAPAAGAAAGPALSPPVAVAAGPAAGAPPSRFDLDGDGLDERVVSTLSGAVIRYASGRADQFDPHFTEPDASLTFAAGDFDGDGYADLAMGDTSDNRDNPAIRDQGAVWICTGSPRGPDLDACRHLSQNTPGVPGTSEFWDAFGAAVATGDLNRDGYADLAVGTSNEQLTSGTGSVTVLFGSATGLTTVGATWIDQNLAWVPGAAQYNGAFGTSVAIGDVTGDGYADLAIAAPGEDARGTVTLVRGAATGIARTGATRVHYNDLRLTDLGSADLGWSLAIADLNRDGRAEVVAGSPSGGTRPLLRGGIVAVFNGTANGLSRTSFRVIHQDTPGVPGTAEEDDYFGYSLATGDLTGDGYADLLVGSPTEDIDAVPGAGMVTLLRGGANGVTGAGSVGWHQGQAAVPGHAEETDAFGHAVSVLDLDGIGGLDALVGSPNEDIGTDERGLNVGSVTEFVGRAGAPVARGAWHPIALEEEFGGSFSRSLGRHLLSD